MEAEGESSTRFCAGQVEAVHNLECREARKETVSFSESRTPSKGTIKIECRPPDVSKHILVSIFKLVIENLLFTHNCRS